MKIIHPANVNKPIRTVNSSTKNGFPSEVVSNPIENAYSNVVPLKADPVYFGAVYNVNPKKLNISTENSKLLKYIANILENDIAEFDIADYVMSFVQKALGQYRANLKRQDVILERLESLFMDSSMNPQQKMDMANALRKEYNALNKFKCPAMPKVKTPDEKTDFQLINRFKSAVSKGNYNLSKVYEDYYSGLRTVQNLEELSELYPKIKIPQRPEDVVSKKIVETLTRDFYEELDDVVLNQDYDGVYELVDSVARKYSKEIAYKYNLKYIEVYDKLANSVQSAILDKYSTTISSGSFTSIPENRKVKPNLITPNDAKMLMIDFDDFVISVLQKQYLESQKLNQIVYSKDGVSIPISSLSGSEYKFDKVSEKVKSIISSAEKIKSAIRDYGNKTPEELRERLDYYATSEIGNNEILFDRIFLFDSCKFTQDDIKPLEKFLRCLDDVYDGKISIDDAIEYIKANNIRPVGTDKLDAIEQQKVMAKLKLEQQRLFKLTSIQDEFDDVLDTLYQNNMNSVANICSKYRPSTIEEKELANVEYIVRLVRENLSKDKPLNKSKLEAAITRFDTFNYYSSHDMNNPIFQRALQIAKQADGTIDKDKAGQYIINSELVHNYPNSMSFAKNSQVLEKIMQRVSDKEKAVEYLSKYDNYTILSPSDKTRISKLMDLFDDKDAVEKTLLKHIVETDYVNSDTKVLTKISEKGSETIEAAIASSAKQQILAKYKFPLCMDYFKGFEDALSGFSASAWGTSGIKKTGANNNALEYRMELKLKGENDRLFSSLNNYVFDIYSSKGLHK